MNIFFNTVHYNVVVPIITFNSAFKKIDFSVLCDIFYLFRQNCPVIDHNMKIRLKIIVKKNDK